MDAVNATKIRARRPAPSCTSTNGSAASADLMQGWAEWSDAGCLVHPAKADGSKNPVSFEGGSKEADEHGVHGWGYGRIRDGKMSPVPFEQFGEMVKAGLCDGFGVFCGAPSGELEMLEVEGRAVELLPKVKRYADELGDDAPAVLDRVSHGCVQQSPSNGIHFVYRVSGGACGSIVLAARPDSTTKNGRLVLAETRGAGGWFVAAPSGGRTHASGKPYVLLRGSPATIPTLTPSERGTLFTLFRLLDEMPTEMNVEKPHRRERDPGEPLRPGDDFNARGSWETVLKGWKKGKIVGGRQHWTRPGKDKGTSATTTENVLCCFSSSAGLPVFDPQTRGNALCKFSAYAALHHSGDFSAAASALRRDGYGEIVEGMQKGVATNHAGTPQGNRFATGTEWEPFPVELLPSGIRDYVTQTSEGMSTDTAMVAVPMLAALASAIGNTRTIMLKSDWAEPAILWAAIIAESGSLKTPAMRKALQFVVEQEQEIEHRNALCLEQYEQDRVIHETRLATWKQHSRRSGDSAGLPPAPPRKPARTSRVLSDCTIEAVAGILSDNPRGVLLERDELSGWLGGFDRYKAGGAGRVSSEVGHWLSMHNSSPLRLDRKSTGRVYVPRASLSIAGGIQPDTLTQAIGHEHVANGLLARFLLVAPPRRPKRFNTNTAGFMAIDGTRRLFHTLYAIPMPDDGPIAIPLAGDGEAAWEEFYDRHAKRQMDAAGVVASMLAKIEAAAARLALVHYVCRQASDEPTLPNAIDAESVQAGVALAEWFAREWQRVYQATLGGGTTVDNDGELLAWIDSQGGETAVREISQRIRRYRDAAALERTITRLVQAGKLETFSVHNESGGRPAHWVRAAKAGTAPQ